MEENGWLWDEELLDHYGRIADAEYREYLEALEGEKAMTEEVLPLTGGCPIWKLEEGGKVIRGGSFSPLFPMVTKLINQRRSFKVTFGLEYITEMEGTDERERHREFVDVPPTEDPYDVTRPSDVHP